MHALAQEIQAMTKTRPTTKKLPKANVMFGYAAQYADGSCYVCSSGRRQSTQDLTLAVIPTATKAQARAICKAVSAMLRAMNLGGGCK